MRYGYMIRLGGDREISEALARGADASMQLIPARASSSEAVRRVAMWQHTPEEWHRMTLDARRRYRRNRQPQGVRKALLVGYALACYGVSLAWDVLTSAMGM